VGLILSPLFVGEGTALLLKDVCPGVFYCCCIYLCHEVAQRWGCLIIWLLARQWLLTAAMPGLCP